MASLARSGSVSSLELVDAHLDRIEKRNPELNAFTMVLADQARESARRADQGLKAGRLHGVPVTVKDSFDLTGLPTRLGSFFVPETPASEDAAVVARLRREGAIVLGKTNTPEFLVSYESDNFLTGRTNNPWDLERTPGGSSGGEAAAIASGCSPGGVGSDGGGSIRVPAHFCGIVGLKPTWGTIPTSGHMAPGIAAPPPLAHMATIGPMARYVDDLTLAYNIVKGPHPSTPYTVPTADAHPEKVDLKRIRCAIFTDACEVPVAPDIRAAIERAGRELQKLGIIVEAVKPPVDDGERLWWAYSGADGNQLMHQAHGEHLKLSRDRLRNSMVVGEGKSAAEFFKIAMERDAWRVQLAEFMERYPIILGPTFCVTAFKHGATEVEIDGKKYPHFFAGWPVAWGNCAGLPGVVVPCGKDREGLPIGLQINGRAFGEETVLAVAKAAETALGGYQKPPI